MMEAMDADLNQHEDEPATTTADNEPLFAAPPPPVRHPSADIGLELPVEVLSSAEVESGLLPRLIDDQTHFYSAESLMMLGGGLAVGGLAANTKLDWEIEKKFQSGIRGATADDWFESLHAGKELGNGLYTLPVYGACWIAGEVFPKSPSATRIGDWGERTTRGLVVGAPPMLALQFLLGGGRPGETDERSRWTPLQDNNGVSGHSFMGSLPFLTAAKMSERPATRTLLYAASAIAPLSRVNDNAHYPSQAALGWFVAYLAADAVNSTEQANQRLQMRPYITPDETGFVAEYAY
jgi:hypothetical protein